MATQNTIVVMESSLTIKLLIPLKIETLKDVFDDLVGATRRSVTDQEIKDAFNQVMANYNAIEAGKRGRIMDRTEHLQWCKNRALEYVDAEDMAQAVASMCSDLSKHPETSNHPGIQLGAKLMLSGNMSKAGEMEKWIQGFN